MPHWSDTISKENTAVGTRIEVSKADFSFEMGRNKAMTAEQIAMDLNGVHIPENGKVWPVDMANTMEDRHRERFSKPYLDKITKQINGASETFNLFHEKMIPVGKVLPKAALVMSETGNGYTMKGYVWINNKSKIPSQPDITVNEAIETGMLKDVSVEVSGTVKWVEDGGKSVLEWYVDPERPDSAEMTGMALVQKGAQRGASVSMKSLDGGGTLPIKNAINTTMYRDKFFVGEKEYVVSAKQEGTEVKAEGVDALVNDFKASVKSEKEAVTAKEKAVADLAAEKASIEPVRKSLIADCENFGKAIGETHKAEDLEKLSFKDLFAKREEILKKHDEPAKQQQKSIDFQPTEAY